jgi:nitroreductase
MNAERRREATVMDAFEAIKTRKTIRDFDGRKVDDAVRDRIIEAGMAAPSNDHMRKWEFVVVDDRAARLRIIRSIASDITGEAARKRMEESGLTDDDQREMYIDAIPKQRSMLLDAGLLIVPCYYEPGKLLTPSDLSSLNYFASIWCSIENMLIEASSENVYGVTRIPSERDRVAMRSELRIPDEYEIPCVLALGYPEADARRTKQKAFSVADRIHTDRW